MFCISLIKMTPKLYYRNNGENMKTKIGILGGTFDPIHNGHIMLANAALKELNLDKVVFMPTGVSYMKTGVSLAVHRYEMCRLSILPYPFFEIDDEEVKREGNTYTYETLRYMNRKYPDAEIYFIIGLDTLYTIETWKNVSEVFANCILVCADRISDISDGDIKKRVDELKSKYAARIVLLNMRPYPISSTEIRETIYSGRFDNAVLNHLPEPVKDYIIKHDLYSRISYLKREMELRLKPKRYQHTLGVYETAIELAGIYGADVQKAAISALLHDVAKHIALEELLQICEDYGLVLHSGESKSTALLHGKAGAILAKTNYQIDDGEIFDAIFYHTTGTVDMTLLTQIIFVADYIEPNRVHASNLEELRELAKCNLNKTTAIILRDTLNYLKEKNENNIDTMTEKAYAFYRKYL